MDPVVLTLDGNSLAHRAYHAYRARSASISDPYGRPASAVYGFLALFAAVCDKVRGRYGRLDAVIVGFDDPTSSWRRSVYAGYKAHRSEKDPALVDQLAALPKLLNELGIVTIVPDGLEADDVVASVAAVAEQRQWRCVIATSDRDAFS